MNLFLLLEAADPSTKGESVLLLAAAFVVGMVMAWIGLHNPPRERH